MTFRVVRPYKASVELPGSVRMAPTDWLGAFRTGRDSTFASGLRSIIAHNIKILNDEDRPFFLREAKEIVRARGLGSTNTTTQTLAKDALAALNEDLAKVIWPARDDFASKAPAAQLGDLETVLATAKQHSDITCPWLPEAKLATRSTELAVKAAARNLLQHFIGTGALQRSEVDELLSDSSSPPRPPLPPQPDFTGRIGQYTIVSKIGQGGMGSVYLCKNTAGKLFAVKSLLLKEQLQQPSLPPAEIRQSVLDSLLRFKREYEIGAKLDHPNIASSRDTNLFEVFPDIADGEKFRQTFDLKAAEAAPAIFIVVDFIPEHEGRNVPAPTLEKIAKTGMAEGPALEITLQLLDALEHYHSNGVEHRDLKPRNILITEDQLGARRAVIVDNGISRDVSRKTQVTRADQLVGTHEYMAPLTYGLPAKKGLHFGKVDIYGLGLILLEALTGKNQLREIAADIKDDSARWKAYMRGETALDVSGIANPALRVIIGRMLSVRPEDNYDTTSEVIKALRRLGQANSSDALDDGSTIKTPVPIDTFKETLQSFFTGNLPANREEAIRLISARIPEISAGGDKDLLDLVLDSIQLLSVKEQ